MYSAPVIRIAAGISTVPELEWDPSTSSLSIALPSPSFPLVIAFGLGAKLPDVKGGFHFAFPSFKFGSKGEVEEESSSSESDDDGGSGKKKRGFGIDIKAPKLGFGGKKDKKDKKGAQLEVEKPAFSVGAGGDIGGKVQIDKPALPVEVSAPDVHGSASGKFKVYYSRLLHFSSKLTFSYSLVFPNFL